MNQTPKIRATFRLDGNGQPEAIERDGLRHYRLQLQVEGTPDDTYAVTYVLHPTYYDPVREVRDKSSQFAEELTSFGDYTVQAKIRTREGVTTVARPLVQALREGLGSAITPAIEAALGDLAGK